jgi:hypothetical protein
MGEEASGMGKFRLGLEQSGARTARALGIPQTLRAAGVPLDPQGDEALDAVAKGTGVPGALGDFTGSTIQGIGAGRLLTKAAPAALTRFAGAHPKTAAYLGSAGGSSGITAAMTPGDLETRGIEASKAAAMALPMTFAARQIAQPLTMNQAGQNLKAATGEVPPVHIGAESKLVRDTGSVVKDIPFMGNPLLSGEERVFGSGVRQLWAQATPPGKDTLLQVGDKVRRGQLFNDLSAQFDDTYSLLLKGVNVPIRTKDKATIVQIIDGTLTPADARQVHKFISNRFPKDFSVSGKTWKELQDTIRDKADEFRKGGTTIDNKMAQTYDRIDKYLSVVRNRGLAPGVVQKLDATDQAFASRKILETAVALPGGERELTPNMLSKALRIHTSEDALARGQGTNQSLIDPLAASLGDMGEKNTAQALWNFRRLISPAVTGLATGMATGVPALAAAPAGIAAGMNLLGSGRRGASVMFGDTGPQRAMAQWLRNRPMDIPGAVSGLDLQTQE